MRSQNLISSLYLKYQLELRRVITSKFKKSAVDAEDILHDTFHNLLKVDNFEEIENPRAYIYQTASNLALNRIRKNNNHEKYLAKENFDATNEVSPERSVIGIRNLESAENALQQLSEKYIKTFRMSRLEHKTYKEIAHELNISESTVEKHVIKVLKHLRDNIDSGVDA